MYHVNATNKHSRMKNWILAYIKFWENAISLASFPAILSSFVRFCRFLCRFFSLYRCILRLCRFFINWLFFSLCRCILRLCRFFINCRFLSFYRCILSLQIFYRNWFFTGYFFYFEGFFQNRF